jgi:hypothetical protein
MAPIGSSVWVVTHTTSEGTDVQLFAMRSDAETWIRAEADELQEDSAETYERAENLDQEFGGYLTMNDGEETYEWDLSLRQIR